MGMQFHGLADHVGYLLEAAVIHIIQRLQDAALYRLQAVIYIGDSALFDDIRGILHEIFIKEFVEFPEISTIFHGGVNRVDFYNLPVRDFKKNELQSGQDTFSSK